MAPPVRLELTTSKLTASCSTIELQGIVTIIVSNPSLIVKRHIRVAFMLKYKHTVRRFLCVESWAM